MILHQNAHGEMNEEQREVIVDSVRIATAHLPPRKRYEATFKCSFDLGSKKHKCGRTIHDGKNYVDITRLTWGTC